MMSATAKKVSEVLLLTPIFVLLVLIAMAGSMVMPVIPVLIVDYLGGQKSDVALYFCAWASTGVFVNIIVGRLVDLTRQKALLLSACAIWLLIGSVLNFYSQNVFQIILISLFFVCMYSCPSLVAFSMARVLASKSKNVVSRLRIGFVVGWVMGPAIGAVLLTKFGPRDVFIIQGIAYLLVSIISVVFFKRLPQNSSAETTKPEPPNKETKRLLALYACIVALLLSGDLVRFSLFPDILTRKLNGTATDLAICLSLVPISEIFCLILLNYIYNKYGAKFALLIGASAGVAFFTGIAFVSHIWMTYFLHVLYAFVPASVLGVGLSYAQDLAPRHIGLASASVFSGQQVAVLGGSGLSVALSYMLTSSAAFLVPSILIVVASCLLVFLIPGRIVILAKHRVNI